MTARSLIESAINESYSWKRSSGRLPKKVRDHLGTDDVSELVNGSNTIFDPLPPDLLAKIRASTKVGTASPYRLMKHPSGFNWAYGTGMGGEWFYCPTAHTSEW